MEGHKDPFNRRTYPWGAENHELMAHFRRLGQLRAEHAVLRLGDIRFLQADQGRLAFSRSYDGTTVRIYVNQSGEAWDIPAGRILLGHCLRTVAPSWLTVGHNGFCAVEDV